MKQIPTKTSLISFETILEQAEIEEGHITADLGCGNSLFFLYKLTNILGKKGLVYGIDILDANLRTIEHEIKHHDIPGITLLQANLDLPKGTPLADNSLDRAFLINTLHQSTDSLTMLLEISRLLNENGILLLVDWENNKSPLGPHQNRRISSESAKETVGMAGFIVKNHFKAGPYHYGLVLKKK